MWLFVKLKSVKQLYSLVTVNLKYYFGCLIWVNDFQQIHMIYGFTIWAVAVKWFYLLLWEFKLMKNCLSLINLSSFFTSLLSSPLLSTLNNWLFWCCFITYTKYLKNKVRFILGKIMNVNILLLLRYAHVFWEDF